MIVTESNTQTEEFYDDATSGFPAIEDLDGRLVAIWALDKGEAVSTTNNKKYPFIETVTFVLDDGVDGDKISELVPEAPRELEFRHSTTGLVARLRGRVGRVDADNKPVFKPMLGRINSQPSRANKKVLAYSIAEPTDYDRAVANDHETAIRAISARLTKEAAKSEDTEAFDS